ncbi:protein gm [Echinococcus multilocularis]|uniref:Protein gm n=1 Tax=Echinococcus multilocularis TaxID=6211 RepID=A0A0S4MI21_ECHMU|nr:protein gm [Echinococcus multilocularis]
MSLFCFQTSTGSGLREDSGGRLCRCWRHVVRSLTHFWPVPHWETKIATIWLVLDLMLKRQESGSTRDLASSQIFSCCFPGPVPCALTEPDVSKERPDSRHSVPLPCSHPQCHLLVLVPVAAEIPPGFLWAPGPGHRETAAGLCKDPCAHCRGKCPEALAKEAEEEDCQIDCPAGRRGDCAFPGMERPSWVSSPHSACLQAAPLSQMTAHPFLCPDPGLLGASTAELSMQDTLVVQEKRSLVLEADAKPKEDAEILDPMAAGSPVLPEAGTVQPLALASEDTQALVD